MQSSELLQTIAGVAVALTGFSGVACSGSSRWGIPPECGVGMKLELIEERRFGDGTVVLRYANQG